MTATSSCVLLADRHHGLSEGVRGLLETTFATVFMVGDEASLLDGAQRLQPPVVVVDVAFAAGDLPGLLRRLNSRSPRSKIVVLTVHDQDNVVDVALRSGAHGVVLKRCIATDLLTAIDEVLAGRMYKPSGKHCRNAAMRDS
jgi:DNA-binding NarL/FixJ family response regulator